MEEVSGADERSQGMSRGWVWEVLGNERGCFLESWGQTVKVGRGHRLGWDLPEETRRGS